MSAFQIGFSDEKKVNKTRSAFQIKFTALVHV